jgi:hypothetical protein
MSLPPKLIGSLRKEPFGTTIYLEIALGDGIPAVTGVFFPSKYKPEDRIDLILYLHGHVKGCGGDTKQHSIEKVWTQDYFPFREKLNDTGKNLLLVAPTLGLTSEDGNLARKGGRRYLDEVLLGIFAYGPYDQLRNRDLLFPVGNIILACHSGGGGPMFRLARSMTGKEGRGDYGGYLRECWGFDCMYGIPEGAPETLWAAWAHANPRVELFFYWHDTKARTMRLDEAAKTPPYLKNVHVSPEFYDAPASMKGKPTLKTDPDTNKAIEPWTPEHCMLPITFWGERIKAARLQ